MVILKAETVRYECAFCGKQFKTVSECAKHIEEESITNYCFPSDIITIGEEVIE